MKCPKCHKEVEKGSLYCPYCLAEIPWVREFSTVETLMKKEQQNRPSEKKQKTEIIKYFKHPKRRKLKFSRKQLLCLLLCAAILLGFFCYRQLNTFSALYSRAKKQYAQQNYEEAQRIAENALDKNPKNEAANLLLAKSIYDPRQAGWTHCHAAIILKEETAQRHHIEIKMQEPGTDKVFTILGFGVL